jgi:hypothetical protein
VAFVTAYQRREEQQPAAMSPTLFTKQRITKLTDAAMSAFEVLYDMERQHRSAVKARIKAALHEFDLFGAGAHYRNDEEYKPGGDAG